MVKNAQAILEDLQGLYACSCGRGRAPPQKGRELPEAAAGRDEALATLRALLPQRLVHAQPLGLLDPDAKIG
jgi:hypothetical protein